ncbi:MAG: SDR family NAD(P)-dependent oxidoreductase [Actinomycetota bacterium]
MTDTTQTERFAGRVCVVAGGARGIGAATVRRVVSEGGRVVVGDVNRELAEELGSELGDDALVHPLDVRDRAACRDVVSAAVERFGRVDHLVNCALQHAPGALADLPLDSWQQVVDIGLTGTFLMSQAVGRRLIDQGEGGSIVNVASLAGLTPYDGTGAYSTVKAGVVMLSRQMAVEWAPHGIRVNSVCPGHILTPLTAYLQDPEIRRVRSEATPLGRVGETSDVAAGILYLLSDESAYVTGTELVVDGGLANTVFPNLPGRTFG